MKVKYFLVWIFFAASLLLLLKVLLLNFYPDFNVYYFATKDAFRHINPYTKTYFTGFSYPPTVLPFLISFSLLPFLVAEKVWTVLSLLCLFASLLIIFRMTKGLSLIEKLCLSGLIFLLFPVKFTLGMGQINLIVLLLFTLGMYYYQKNKHTMSGIFFGLSLLLKLFPILFLLYFVLQKKWKLLFFIGITFCLGVGLVALLFGTRIIVFFFQHGLGDIFFSLKTDYYNQALSGFLGRLPVSSVIFRIFRTSLTLAILLVTFYVLWWKKRSTVNHESRLNRDEPITNNYLPFSLLLTTSLITNTFSWQHHFVWLIPAYVFVYSQLRLEYYSSRDPARAGESRSKFSTSSNNKTKQIKSFVVEYLILVLSYLLVASNLAMPYKFPIFVESHVLYGALILWTLNMYLLFKSKG